MSFPSIKNLINKYKTMDSIVGITAYDACFSSIVDPLGFDFILVGDSLGMVVLGYKNTIPVTIKDMVHHASAVVRGAPKTFVIVDMPFMSYQESSAMAIRNAGRIIQKTGAQAVKIEGGSEIATTVRKIVQSGIPVMGHVGLKPQHINTLGQYSQQGVDIQTQEKIKEDCFELEKAGCFAIVLECVSQNLANELTQASNIPTIGIGSGLSCSGQVLVINDILGLTSGHVPAFARQYIDIRTQAKTALLQYKANVQSSKTPTITSLS